MTGNETTPDFLDSMASQAADLPDPPEQAEPIEAANEDDPKGETVPATAEAEAAAAPPAAAPREAQMVPLAGLMDEREKRQRLERELEQMRRQQGEREQQPATSFYVDPERHVQELVGQVEQRTTQRMYSALEAEARIAFPDYDEVFSEVEEYAKTNPAVAQQVLQAANPARAAYELGKRIREHREMQNPDEYRQKIERELRAKWDAEQAEAAKLAEQGAAVRAEKIAAIPPDLSKTASATAATRERKSPVFNQLFDKPAT